MLITAAITGAAAWYFLGVAPIIALLLGAVLASTDPATLVPVFKQVKIKERVSQTVMTESAFNDAMGATVTLTVLGVAMGAGDFSATDAVVGLLKQSFIGILIGAVLGYLAAVLISHEKLGFLAEFAPVVTLMAVAADMWADACTPAASWRYSCSASCWATRNRWASNSPLRKTANSKNT